MIHVSVLSSPLSLLSGSSKLKEEAGVATLPPDSTDIPPRDISYPLRTRVARNADAHIYRELRRGMRATPLLPNETWADALPELLRHSVFMPMHGRVRGFGSVSP